MNLRYPNEPDNSLTVIVVFLILTLVLLKACL